MKKIFSVIVIMFMCLCFVGCGNVNLDLDEVSNSLDNLSSNEFDMFMAMDNIEMNGYYSDLVDVYDFDLETFGINKDNIESMVFKVSANNEPAYIIIKPLSDKTKVVKKELSAYMNKFSNLKDILETEYEGHLIYINSPKNKEILKQIKNSKKKIFGMLMNVEGENIENLLGVKTSDLDSFLVKNSTMIQANSYYILKPKKGFKDDIKRAMDEYMKKLEQQWETYLPDQYELVKNRLEKEYGDYLIYIISKDNDLVFKEIKKYNK